MDLIPLPPPQFPAGLPDGVQPSAPPKFRLATFWLLLAKYWWVPTVTLVLCPLVAVVYESRQPATFLSRGSMWETMKLQSPEGPLFNENTEDLPGTQSDLMHSSMMRERVLARLRTASNPAAIPLAPDGEPQPVAVRMSQTAKSAVFVLEADGPAPAYTQAYLEALMESYLEYKTEIRRQISGDTLASIARQLESTTEKLKNEQDILAEFEHSNNLAILQEEGTVAGGYLTKLKTQFSDLQSEEALLRTALEDEAGADNGQTNQTTRELEALNSLLDADTGGRITEFQNKIKQLDLLKLQRAAWSVNLRDQHPKMQQLEADIERAGKELAIDRRQFSEQLTAARETTLAKIQSVQGSIRDWEARVVDANSRIAEAERLKSNVQRTQAEYDQLAALAQNFKISRDFDQETLAILEHASPASRSHDAMKRAIGSAVLGGLMLGLGVIAWLTIRDEKFGSIVDLKERLGNHVIAQVPESPAPNGYLSAANDATTFGYAESYRSLRSALMYQSEKSNSPKVVLITSALPNEGKSTVAANLAHTLALGGARVLLVDADLRRGVLHERLNLKPGPGLSHLLSHPADRETTVQTNSLPNLSFIACGDRVANPGDRFLGASLDELFHWWRRDYDYVLIDSCPIFATDDTTALAAKVDGILFVVRSRYSSARQVRDALGILHQRRAKVYGVVFNRANASSGAYDQYNYATYFNQDDARLS